MAVTADTVSPISSTVLPPGGRILACLSTDKLDDGIQWISKYFTDSRIYLEESSFDDESTQSQVLLFIEEDLKNLDTAFKLIACRDFNYLIFGKQANPNWRNVTTVGKLVEENDDFVIWSCPTRE